MFVRILFCALMIVSCGRGNDDDNEANPVANVPLEEANTNRRIRYTSIVLEENCGFWTDCDFTIRADYNRRPVILTANFVDDGWPTDQPAPDGGVDTISEGTCNFQVTLTETQADHLEAFADKLRFCQEENTPTADGGFDGLFSTDTSGKESMVYKFKDRGQEEEGKISYICAGRAGYYNYMRKIIFSKAPDHCPSGYKRLFN